MAAPNAPHLHVIGDGAAYIGYAVAVVETDPAPGAPCWIVQGGIIGEAGGANQPNAFRVTEDAATVVAAYVAAGYTFTSAFPLVGGGHIYFSADYLITRVQEDAADATRCFVFLAGGQAFPFVHVDATALAVATAVYP